MLWRIGREGGIWGGRESEMVLGDFGFFCPTRHGVSGRAHNDAKAEANSLPKKFHQKNKK